MLLSEVPGCYQRGPIFSTYHILLGRWRALDAPIWVFGIGFYSVVVDPSQNVHNNLPKWLEQLMELGDIDDT